MSELSELRFSPKTFSVLSSDASYVFSPGLYSVHDGDIFFASLFLSVCLFLLGISAFRRDSLETDTELNRLLPRCVDLDGRSV